MTTTSDQEGKAALRRAKGYQIHGRSNVALVSVMLPRRLREPHCAYQGPSAFCPVLHLVYRNLPAERDDARR